MSSRNKGLSHKERLRREVQSGKHFKPMSSIGALSKDVVKINWFVRLIHFILRIK
jgi:hypothetical protein